MKRAGLAAALAAIAFVMVGCQRDMGGNMVLTAGSYARTCRNTANTADGTLTAECLDTHGQFHAASIAAAACHTDIANINGALVCSH